MTHDMEMALVRELGRLRDEYTLTDTSAENKARGDRIKEIRKELGLNSKPKKNYTPCKYRAR